MKIPLAFLFFLLSANVWNFDTRVKLAASTQRKSKFLMVNKKIWLRHYKMHLCHGPRDGLSGSLNWEIENFITEFYVQYLEMFMEYICKVLWYKRKNKSYFVKPAHYKTYSTWSQVVQKGSLLPENMLAYFWKRTRWSAGILFEGKKIQKVTLKCTEDGLQRDFLSFFNIQKLIGGIYQFGIACQNRSSDINSL